jgi:hypothetical protein
VRAEGTYGSLTDGRLGHEDREVVRGARCLPVQERQRRRYQQFDPATLARAIALACAPEPKKLVEISNRDGDPRAANA